MTSHPAIAAPANPLRKVVTAASATATALVALALFVTPPANAASVTETFKGHTASSTQTVDHSAWTALLGQYVIAGPKGLNRVNYKAFKSNSQGALKSYIKTLQTTRPAELSRNEQFAFWANLYNAKTIDIILDHYPVKSIKDISLESGLFDFLKKSVGAGGPWKTKVLTVAGTRISLDDIEHQILRPIFKDPRVHYAVNCASIGCPNLGREAFTGTNINAQLDAGARAYVNHPRGVSINTTKVTASSIYSWFNDDFGGAATGVLKHIRKYANDDLKAKLAGIATIDEYDYDWNLNDTTN